MHHDKKQSAGVRQLETLHWVNRLGADKFVVSTGYGQKTYNPISHEDNEAYKYSYTFFHENPTGFVPPNALI
jgi:hypothetical protein